MAGERWSPLCAAHPRAVSAAVTKVVLATRNQHKVVELRHILSDVVEELTA